MAIVRELEPAGMAQHVRVDRKGHLGSLTDALDEPVETDWTNGPQAVPIGDQDHGCVALPVAAVLAGTVHQPLDLTLGEVASLNCQVYDAWRAFLDADSCG